MTLVLGGSVAIAWCFWDERTPLLDALQLRVELEGGFVPAIWSLEVANALLMGLRRRRLTAVDRDALVDSLRALEVQQDDRTDQHVWSTTTVLAERHGLTIYDASYLELALRRRLPLATLDTALARGAIAEAVTVLP